MQYVKQKFNQRQLIYQEIVIGTLVYAVTLGFLNDYTQIVDAKSFSTIFFASLVLEILTFITFKIKNYAVHQLKKYQSSFYKITLFLSVWFIMFISKFVFIWILDVIFGTYISINGFFGILLVVVLVTLIHKFVYTGFSRLGDS